MPGDQPRQGWAGWRPSRAELEGARGSRDGRTRPPVWQWCTPGGCDHGAPHKELETRLPLR